MQSNFKYYLQQYILYLFSWAVYTQAAGYQTQTVPLIIMYFFCDYPHFALIFLPFSHTIALYLLLIINLISSNKLCEKNAVFNLDLKFLLIPTAVAFFVGL